MNVFDEGSEMTNYVAAMKALHAIYEATASLAGMRDAPNEANTELGLLAPIFRSTHFAGSIMERRAVAQLHSAMLSAPRDLSELIQGGSVDDIVRDIVTDARQAVPEFSEILKQHPDKSLVAAFEFAGTLAEVVENVEGPLRPEPRPDLESLKELLEAMSASSQSDQLVRGDRSLARLAKQWWAKRMHGRESATSTEPPATPDKDVLPPRNQDVEGPDL
jgi:hypothetical protein